MSAAVETFDPVAWITEVAHGLHTATDLDEDDRGAVILRAAWLGSLADENGEHAETDDERGRFLRFLGLLEVVGSEITLPEVPE